MCPRTAWEIQILGQVRGAAPSRCSLSFNPPGHTLSSQLPPQGMHPAILSCPTLMQAGGPTLLGMVGWNRKPHCSLASPTSTHIQHSMDRIPWVHPPQARQPHLPVPLGNVPQEAACMHAASRHPPPQCFRARVELA